jgi:hypothetical protein
MGSQPETCISAWGGECGRLGGGACVWETGAAANGRGMQGVTKGGR